MARRSIDLFMLTWNRCEYTAMTLRSLETTASGIPWHKVNFTVIDQNSTDDTLEIVRGSPMVTKVVELRKNRGVAGGMDYFRQNCMSGSSSYVGKIDNDSLFTPGWLKKLLRALQGCPELGLVGAAQSNLTRPTKVVGKNGAGYYPASFIGGRFLCRREVFMVGAIKGKGLYGWQPYQRRCISPQWKIGWCYPTALIEHVGDWKMRHPRAIKNDEYRAYMKKVGRSK
jgi:glycosyltransferase involved in cell wall biosynthesis